MVNKNNLDELLYKYMPIVDEVLIEELESQVDEDYVFSEKFEKRMERVIRWNKYYPKVERIKKAVKYMAASIIVIIGLSIPFHQEVQAYSEKILERIKTIWEDSFIYTYFIEDTVYQEQIELKEPSYIPQDYTRKSILQSESMCYAIYENELGNQITYQQMLITDEKQIVMDLEYEYEKNISLKENNLEIYFYTDGFIQAYYSGEQYIWNVTATDISEDEIYKMLDSVVSDSEK